MKVGLRNTRSGATALEQLNDTFECVLGLPSFLVAALKWFAIGF